MRIRGLRNEFNLTQEELGKIIGQTKSNISKYETGALEPGNDTLIKIAAYFNVSLDYLMGASDVRNPYKEESEQVDQFLIDLSKKAVERGLEFDENSVDDLLDLYEFLKKRDKK